MSPEQKSGLSEDRKTRRPEVNLLAIRLPLVYTYNFVWRSMSFSGPCAINTHSLNQPTNPLVYTSHNFFAQFIDCHDDCFVKRKPLPYVCVYISFLLKRFFSKLLILKTTFRKNNHLQRSNLSQNSSSSKNFHQSLSFIP